MKRNIPADIPQKEKSYDHIFKEILETFPSRYIIAFLNSVFKHNISLNSAVESMRTESNIGNRTIADYILKVTEPSGIIRYFHIEAQTSNDRGMAFRMVEYGIRFALERAKNGTDKDEILIEFPHAAVFYLKDNRNTPRVLNVTVKAPDGKELHYSIPTERMSDYTPEELLEQEKYPLFPFYMANFTGKDPDKFEREWLAGCAKLNEFVKSGRIGKPEADKLLESGSIVVKKVNHPNEKEVLREMDSMFEPIGVGVDWIELKRQKEEAVSQAEHRKALATAKKALAKGITAEDAADLTDLPIDEVLALSGN